MRRLVICLSALFLFASAGLQAVAQDHPGANQKSVVPPATTEPERPKSAVDKMVEEARARGEKVLAVCIDKENCDEGEGLPVELEVGRAVELPKPNYPRIAAMAHASGTVQVQVIIDTDGSVIAAAAVSGHPLLQAVSVQAARESRFTPTLLNGEPVKVTGVIQYNFVSQ